MEGRPEEGGGGGWWRRVDHLLALRHLQRPSSLSFHPVSDGGGGTRGGGGGERREVSLFFPPNVPLLGIYIREETVSVLVCEVAFLV